MAISDPVEVLGGTTDSSWQFCSIAGGACLSEAINLSKRVGDAGMIGIPVGWTAASIGFYVCCLEEGVFSPLRDESGTIVQITGIQTNSESWYKIPEAVRGAMFVKLWSQTSGVNVNQSSLRIMALMTKG